GTGFTNLTDTGVYSGTATDTLTITGAAAGMNGYAYRVVVSGSGGLTLPSTSATLTVNTAPAITSQPSNQSVNEGSNTSFSVTATGTGLGYQWQVDTGTGFTNITDAGVYSGTATNMLSITRAASGMNGYTYRVVVSGAGGLSTPSTSATLTVNTVPTITSQPSNQSVNEGSNTSFSVAATGTGLAYQWQVDTGSGFTNITDTGVYSGTATDTLSITGAEAGMNGYAYRVVVSGSGGLSIPSTSATLTVNTAPAITSQPSDKSVNEGSDTSFSVTATGTGLGYQWQVDTGTGFTNLTDTGVYSGTSTDTLSITGAEAGMNGYTYRVVVSGAGGLSTPSTSATLTVNTAPTITSQPSNQSVNEGGNTNFTVAATGTGLAYQWQVDTGSGFTNITDTGVYSGTATDTLTITGAAAGMNGNTYRVVVSGAGGLSTPSTSATLTVNTAPTITSQPSNQSVNEGSDTSFSVTATGTGLGYQWQVDTGTGFTNITDAGVYSGAATDTLSITGAEGGMNGYTYRVVVSGAGGLSTPSTSATLTVNTAPAITSQPSNQSVNEGSDTSFSVTATGTGLAYQWQVDTGTGFTNLTDTGVYSGTATDTLTITGAAAGMNGNTYRVVVSGAGGLSIPSTSATLTVNTAPAITSQPSNQSVNEGSNTSFSVTATGTALTYQWQVDTGSGTGFTDITDTGVYSGAATDTLSITGAASGMNGYAYRVVVSGSGGLTLPSTSATLTVNTAPGAPAIVSTVAGNAQARLTWNPVSGSTSYKIFTSTTSHAYGAEATTVSGSVYSTEITGLTNGTTYYFIVRALNGSSESPNSNEVSATPQVPSPGAPVLQPVAAGDATVSLAWNPVDGSTGYKIFKSVNAGTYETEVTTVLGSVYSYEVTGLINGTTYYFVVKASNPGGESDASNEVSAMPKTVPAAPTLIAATAGNGQATISFTAPANNGGSPVTGYEVTSSPGNIVVTGATSPMTIIGLSNGTTYTFTVKAINSAGSSAASVASNAVTPRAPSSDSDSSPSTEPYTPGIPAAPSTPETTNTGVDVLVNGKAENAGTAATTTVNEQTVTTITVDHKKLEEKLSIEGQRAVITIPMNTKSDVVVGELNGQMVKTMEQKLAVLEIKTEKATYTLPAQQININSISDQIGKNVALPDIKIQIEIAAPTAETVKIVQNSAAQGEFTIVAPPLNFTVRGIYGDTRVEVSKFNAYVERTIAIPDGIDPNKITTGIVVEPDGIVRHVPTKIVIVDGKYYAKVNSLTNSTYSVVWHPLMFKDVEQHWAKNAVNDMGSRMVINGIGNGLFNPDQDITRAEFAVSMVRGLGLKPESGAAPFTDVATSDWYNEAIQTAYLYNLIGGFEDGTFRPMDKITREQAMTIMAKAMTITDLKAKLPSQETGELLRPFIDANNAAEWAEQSIADCLQAGIVSGRNSDQLAPKAYITRAEVAAIVQRLLQKSELI
ncbi:S-layer homology domain-containing protein, partial [Paenibacillus validus]|nr:S-layer homology domain-containing protein [Paenibacillus validus]